MHFLLDVNASGAVAQWLIHRGHDVAEVGRKDPKMSDTEILDWALKENRIAGIWNPGLSSLPRALNFESDPPVEIRANKELSIDETD